MAETTNSETRNIDGIRVYQTVNMEDGSSTIYATKTVEVRVPDPSGSGYVFRNREEKVVVGAVGADNNWSPTPAFYELYNEKNKTNYFPSEFTTQIFIPKLQKLFSSDRADILNNQDNYDDCEKNVTCQVFINRQNAMAETIKGVVKPDEKITLDKENQEVDDKDVSRPEPVVFDPSLQEVDIDIADGKYRKRYGNWCYPEIMRNTTQDRIEFEMYRYEGKTFKRAENLFNLGTRSLGDRLGVVYLPIQSGIKDQSGVDWGGGTLNPLQAYLASVAVNVMSQPTLTGVEGAISSAMSNAADDTAELLKSKGTAQAAALWAAGKAVGTKSLLSRASGAIVNPNLELLFNGPTLRSFDFTFRMSARDESEAQQIRQIIRFFKQGSTVKRADAEIFLKAPNVFKVRYITYRGETAITHPSLNRIKTCACLGCDVDYTPDNSYMTYNDENRTMTAYNLTVKFSELEPVTEDDYFEEGLTTVTNGSEDIGF